MTGNQDRAAEMAAWISAGREILIAECDRVMKCLTETKLEPGNGLAAARHLRAIQLMAKIMPVVAVMCLPDEVISAAKLTRALKRSGLNLSKTPEENMADHERDDSPENLERLRAELESRLARLHDVLQQKRLDEDAERGRAA